MGTYNFRNCEYTKVDVKNSILHIPRYPSDNPECFILKSLYFGAIRIICTASGAPGETAYVHTARSTATYTNRTFVRDRVDSWCNNYRRLHVRKFSFLRSVEIWVANVNFSSKLTPKYFILRQDKIINLLMTTAQGEGYIYWFLLSCTPGVESFQRLLQAFYCGPNTLLWNVSSNRSSGEIKVYINNDYAHLGSYIKVHICCRVEQEITVEEALMPDFIQHLRNIESTTQQYCLSCKLLISVIITHCSSYTVGCCARNSNLWSGRISKNSFMQKFFEDFIEHW